MSYIMFHAIITTATRKLLESFLSQICQSCCSVLGVTMFCAINIKPSKAALSSDALCASVIAEYVKPY